jgi:CheY-like chemotaxis protein
MAEPTTWRVLCVDDESMITQQIKEFIDAESVPEGSADGTFQVHVENDFDAALTELENTRYDAIILDVRLGHPTATTGQEEAGTKLLTQIQQRRFLPVIFYTGLPGLVAEYESTLIRVVEKTEGVDRLLAELRTVIAGGLPSLNRLLLRHVEEVQRRYMWDFVGPNWDRLVGARRDGTELAYLLGRRLAGSLTEANVEGLASQLGGSLPISAGRYHPVRLYLMPPVSEVPMPGEILRSDTSEGPEYRVLLTPACDMAQNKAEFVLVARCLPLERVPRYNKHVSLRSNASRGELRQLLENKLERYYYLPAAVDVPDLVVDFQQLETFKCTELGDWSRVAALDSPFEQAFSSQFTRYFGRLGTPDLDVDGIVARIEASAPERSK